MGFDVGRDYRKVRGTVGMSDNSPSDARVKFEVLGDGRSLLAQELGLGEAVPVDLDITGVLRLELVATETQPSSTYDDATAVFGDFQVLGTPAEVPGYGTGTGGTGSTTTTTLGC